jgi:pantoate--beta-alanine ligase
MVQVHRTIDDMRAATRAARRAGKRRIGLVPTMGALHAGHLALVRAARAECDFVAVSIFVNPLQFGPKEDFAQYPRPFEGDRELLAAEKVDALFAPSTEEMYRAGATTIVEVQELSERLDGKSRPGHFRGVATVVAKLFHIVEPDIAYFGQKDAAQVAVLRRMVRDVDFAVELRVVPIVREQDGLALSSRNQYLDPAQRKAATVLHRALMRVQTLADRGERSAAKLAEAGRSVMAEQPEARLDYFEIVDPDTLGPVEDVKRGALVAVAAYFGSTRLIDNVVLLGTGTAPAPELPR